MDHRRSGLQLGVLGSTLFCASALTATPSLAGGNHHKTILVPVQTVTVQAASPVLYTAAAPVMYTQAQVAAAPLGYTQVQAAAAPMMYQQVQVAASPVAYTQMTAVAAAPLKATGAGLAPAAGPPRQVNVGGVLYNLVPATGASPAVGASPTADDGLTESERATILSRLAPFVSNYKDLIKGDEATLRATVRTKASDIYATVTGKDADSSEAAKGIDSVVDEALGKAPAASTDKASTDATATSSAATQAQQYFVPVAASPAPMQLFLPVKVKHHGHINYYR